ncbi:MAG: hypothetical protein H7336_06130 [Bacteriovorax sp.]|nr:hypothetical protein [Bacteriovorax sp.]
MKINIGYEFNSSAKTLDPSKIEDIYQSNLIENLYSRIIEYDTKGNLTCVLCKKFWIEKSTIVFEFRNDIKTIDGIVISADDAKLSYQRLINSKTNTHGNFSNFIDIENSNSISTVGNILRIEVLKPHYVQFVLPLLASMDFSIITSKAIDEEKKLGYLELRNTSGPYYLKQDDESGKLILHANLHHPFYSKSMAQEINIVPVVYGHGIDDFLDDKIDVLDVTYYPSLPQYERLFNQKIKKFNAHKTLLINVFLINFSLRANKKFTSEQLFYAGSIVSDICKGFKKYGYGFQDVFEFFQSTGTGHLNESQIEHLKKLRLVDKKINFTTPIELGVSQIVFEKMKKAFEQYPEIKVRSFPIDPASMPAEERPDMYLQTTDSSFNEDISLMSYNFSMGYFGTSKIEGDNWIKDFSDLPNKEDRVKKLQNFQLNLLEKPIIMPIGASPYWAIAREDLELNFAENFPGSSWWKIRKK